MTTTPRSRDGLRLWQRIVLIGLAGTVPLFVVSTILIKSSYSVRIQATINERHGLAFLRPLQDLLDLLPRYQIVAARSAAGQAGTAPPLAKLAAMIDAMVDTVSANYAGPDGRAFNFSDSSLLATSRGDARLSVLRARWDSIKDAPAVTVAREGAVEAMISSVRMMIRQVRDQSGLILDNDLDAFYVVDIVAAELPESQDRVGSATTRTAALVREHRVHQGSAAIATMTAMLRLDALDRIVRDAQTALGEDRRFWGVSDSLQANLPPAVDRYRTSNIAFYDALSRATAIATPVVDSVEAAGIRALTDGHHLWGVATAELDRLLVMREQAVRGERLRSYSIISLTLLAAALIMGVIIRGLLGVYYREVLSNEKQLRLVSDNQPNAMVYELLRELDDTPRFLYVSAGVERLNGVTVSAAMRDAAALFGQIIPEDRAVLDTARHAAIAAGRSMNVLLRLRRADGELRWMEFSAAMRRLPDGRQIWDGIETDVTDRKQAELRIQYLNRIYAVLSAINEMIVRERDSTRILERACQIAVERGHFPMAWIGMIDAGGRWLAPVTSSGDVTGYLNGVRIDLSNPELSSGPAGRCCKTGAHQIVNDIEHDPTFARWRDAALQRGYRAFASLPLRVGEGVAGALNLYANETGFFDAEELRLLDELAADIGFALDVHRKDEVRRRAEASLKESEARQRQLEEQVRQSQKMEGIGQLAGGVAHDFNNILSAMTLETELAESDGMTPEIRERITNIRGFVDRAANLTSQLLLFSRRQVMQPTDVNLNDAVTTLTQMLRRIIGEDVVLRLSLHPTPLVTRADAGMIDQVLMNLVVNARDAMPRGGTLSIETSEQWVDAAEVRPHPDVAAGAHVTLTVRDTGVGIPAEHLARIFEPFFTTKEPGKGTGLGLATVFGIVRQHHGWIVVTSDVGRGTAFRILLPAVERSATEPAPAGAARAQPQGGKETILVVEDEADVRRLMRDILKRRGYTVLEAVDGPDAIRVLQGADRKVDLVITDLMMPGGMTGRELAAEIGRGARPVRIIFTSGYSADIAGTELTPDAGHIFLQKPYTSARLLDAVRRCLDAQMA